MNEKFESVWHTAAWGERIAEINVHLFIGSETYSFLFLPTLSLLEIPTLDLPDILLASVNFIDFKASSLAISLKLLCSSVNVLSSSANVVLDEEYSYEMLDSGMMIFKLPNIKGGLIILEKMFKKEKPDYARV